MDLRRQIIQDAQALNSELRRMEIEANIDPKRCTPGGNQLAFFGLRLLGKTRATDIAKIVGELSRVISRSRRKRTYLRFDEMLLRLETEHPARQPLHWSPRIMERCKPHTAALGMSHHDGERVVTVALDDVPQILVAGETGSGKTVLLRNLITSVAANTSPTDLHMILIDPKNEDLRPYADLPHVELFAGKPDAIASAIERVEEEIARRSDDNAVKPYRLLVIIDELAWAIKTKDMQRRVGEIMGIGRSKKVNVVACTQQPTEEGGMGPMMKANVPLRLVGAVSAGQSYTATRRKNAQADMLPPKSGAFLYLAGLDMYRFHTYLMDDDDERRAVGLIRRRWSDSAPPLPQPITTARRDEIDDIADLIRPLWLDGSSKRAMSMHALGRAYGGSFASKIDAAIERLSATTTGATIATHTSESAIQASSSSGKIIKLRRVGG